MRCQRPFDVHDSPGLVMSTRWSQQLGTKFSWILCHLEACPPSNILVIVFYVVCPFTSRTAAPCMPHRDDPLQMHHVLLKSQVDMARDGGRDAARGCALHGKRAGAPELPQPTAAREAGRRTAASIRRRINERLNFEFIECHQSVEQR